MVYFLFGVAACICVYCMMFIGLMNFGAVFAMLGMPYLLLLYLPHFFLIQVLPHRSRETARSCRRSFAAGVALCVLSALFLGAWFRAEHHAVEAAIAYPGRYTPEVGRNYMTDRMLGMHFKYHTALHLFDGWRPPLHDPFAARRSAHRADACQEETPRVRFISNEGALEGRSRWCESRPQRIARPVSREP